MKERPILFSGAMVRALLDGSKTQTRRAVKLQVQHDDSWVGGLKIVHKRVTQALLTFNQLGGKPLGSDAAICPYGQPGDRLWVRETFLDTQGTGIEHRDESGLRHRYAFAADCGPGSYGDQARKDYGLKWKPSIHMPRAASRILLEIVSVRVERLQDISEADAIAEGGRFIDFGKNKFGQQQPGWRCDRLPCSPDDALDSAKWAYANLWESINGTGSWDANPWVWVVEFKRVAAC